MNQRKDSATINFRNLISNEEKYIEKVEFQISSDKFIIPLYQLIKYTQIQQYSNGFMEVIEKFSRKLTKQQSQGKLKTKSISLFFDLIQEESVTITSDEYWDLFRLSKIFNSVILEKYLEQYATDHSNDIDFLINLLFEYENKQISKNDDDDIEILDSNNLVPKIEDQLKNFVDECLKRKNFELLHISTVYKVIKKSDNDKITSDILYDFIMKSKNSRLPLLQFLKVSQLSDEKFNQFFNDFSDSSEMMKKEFSDYLPFDLIYVKRMKDEKQSLQSRINELDEKNNQIQFQNEQLNKKNEEYKKRINEIEEKNNRIQKQNDQINKENEEYQKRINKLDEKVEKIEKQNDQLNVNNEKLQKQIKELKESDAQIQKQNDQLTKYNEKYQKLIKEFEENSKKILKENDQLKEESKKYQKRIKELEGKNKQIQTQNDQLMHNISTSRNNKLIECKYKGNNFDGIFSYLSNNFSNNLVRKGVLTLTDAAILSGHNLNDVIQDNDKEYHNQGAGSSVESDGWFEIDFIERKINLTSYSLKTASGICYSYPKSWRIVGSNNRDTWSILSHQINNSSLKGSNKQNRFECMENNQFYRYIRFIQEDSWEEEFKYNIVLTQIELFGFISSD